MKNCMLLFFFVLFIVACSNQAGVVGEGTAVPDPTPTPTATPLPPCEEDGQVVNDRVSERGISFRVYLPPCYARDADVHYPLLIWTAGPWRIAETANEMIMAGEIRPFIIASPYGAGGAAYEEKITEELLPYVEANYRPLQERPYRAVAGVSHGAAIAARVAWRDPEVYGRLGVISGGISGAEQEQFAEWITAVNPEAYPTILIDIGKDDSIIALTNYLTEELDAHKVPYKFESALGGHNSAYWSQHMEEYVQFLVKN